MILKKVPDQTMQIPDLSYLRSVPQDESILGSVGVSVTSEAFALGSESSPFASANSNAIAFSRNDSQAFGRALAGASGDDYTANVTAVVITESQFNFSKETAVPSDFVVAIDLL